MKYLDYLLVKGDDPWLTLALKCEKENVADLNSIAHEIKAAYNGYEGIVFSTGTALSNSKFSLNKKVLTNFYGCPPVDLRALIKSRRSENQLEECPYCGNPQTPDTLDHFIPKDEWPEFAIYTNNLVPQCRGCAPVKGSNYYCTANTSSKFIHPFYSDLVSRIGFTLSIEMKRGSPEFTPGFTCDASLSSKDIKRIELHITNLKIRSRFIIYCRRKFQFWVKRSLECRFDLEVAMKARLEGIADPGTAKNWETAFITGMLSCPDAMLFITSKMPAVNNFNIDPHIKLTI